MKKRNVSNLLALVVALLMGIVLSAHASSTQIESRSSLRITNVNVDFFEETISISGFNFDDLDIDRISVALGSVGELTINDYMPLEGRLVVDFPVDGLMDGDYLLTIARRHHQNKNHWKHDDDDFRNNKILAYYDLTIGAVGPRGQQGDQGVQGEIGPQGEQGERGEIGSQGAQGDPGPKGLQGMKGDTGEQGPQGEQGLAGPMGPSYPASLVTDRARHGNATVTGIDLNGRTITGSCSAGGNITLNFDWTRAQYATNIQQVSVGFVGGDTRCIASGVYAQSGSSTLNLTCPDTPGPHLLGLRDTHCYGCTNCNAGQYHEYPSDTTPGYGVTAAGEAFIGVVSVQ